MRCLIVEDDKVSANFIKDYCERSGIIKSMEIVETGQAALHQLASNKFDAVFLDFNLPDLTGKEILEYIGDDLPVVMVTSETDFAVEAYQFNVLGYLVKPIKFNDFMKVLKKLQQDSHVATNYIFVKDGQDLVRISYNDILFVKSESNYVTFFTVTGSVMSLQKMSDLPDMLPKNFIRVHRSYIINLDHVKKVENSMVKVADQSIPLSTSYRESLLERLKLL